MFEAVFRGRKEAKLMHWHAEMKKGPSTDAKGRKRTVSTHPADSCNWKALDIEYLGFKKEPRDIRLGAIIDG
jgi:hypothetical protein